MNMVNKCLAPIIAAFSFFGTSATGQIFDAQNVFDYNGRNSSLSPQTFHSFNTRLIFTAKRSYGEEREPWIHDSNGTRLLKNINPTNGGQSFIEKFVVVGEKCFFFAYNPSYGHELWVTNGSTDGTRLVKDIWIGPSGSEGTYSVPQIAAFGEGVIFRANDGYHGTEVWFSDGTNNGTFMVKDIDPAPENGSFPENFYEWNDIAFFKAENSLWRSDGTEAGTFEILSSTGDSVEGPNGFAPFGNLLVFRDQNGNGFSELWITDGTQGGTRPITEFINGVNDPPGRIGEFLVVDDKIFFRASGSDSNYELWMTDGTPEGTMLVKEIRAGSSGSSPSQLTAVDNLLYFVADNGVTDRQIWVSDGTEEGTKPVFSPPLFYGTLDTDPHDLISYQGRLFFKMRYVDGFSNPVGTEFFFISDEGTPHLVRDIGPGTTSGASPSDFAIHNGSLYISGNGKLPNDSPPNIELWRIFPKLSITSGLLPRIVRLGGDYTLNFTTDQAPVEVQWFRNNSFLPGYDSTVLPITDATASDAGRYHAICTNSFDSSTTNFVEVAVLDSETKTIGSILGGTVGLGIKAHGNNISYQWKHDGQPLSDGGRVSGSNSDRLTIRDLIASDVGNYTCEVSIPGASLTSHVQTVTLVTPPVVSETAPPPTMVSRAFSWTPVVTQTPTHFRITGLPAGMVYDRATGEISGKARRGGSYNIRITASNAAGTSQTQTVVLVVEDIPNTIVGTFQGLVDRDLKINGDLGGSVIARVTKTGQLSGNFQLGAKRVRFRGQIDANSGTGAVEEVTISVRNDQPYLLIFTFDADTQELTGSISQGAGSANFLCYRRTWNRVAGFADRFSGRYNCASDLENNLDNNIAYPQGSCISTVLVTRYGFVRIIGSAADGGRFSFGTTLSQIGEIPYFSLMHGGRASFMGVQQITVGGSAPDFLESFATGVMTWLKKPDNRRGARNYPDGFGLARMTLNGGKWIQPARGELVIPFPDTSPNARFYLFRGPLPSVSAEFTLDSRHRVLFDQETNDLKMTAQINPRNGTYRGNFVSSDVHPLDTGKMLRRTGRFQGIVDPRLNFGYGHFLILDFPTVEKPFPNLRSGAIQLRHLP